MPGEEISWREIKRAGPQVMTLGGFAESQEPRSAQICKESLLFWFPRSTHGVLQGFSQVAGMGMAGVSSVAPIPPAPWQVLFRAACARGAVSAAPPAGPAGWPVPPFLGSCAGFARPLGVHARLLQGGAGGERGQGSPGRDGEAQGLGPSPVLCPVPL